MKFNEHQSRKPLQREVSPELSGAGTDGQAAETGEWREGIEMRA